MDPSTCRLRRALLASVVLGVATVRAGVARADDVVSVRIDYEPRPGCPGADAFQREVLARAPRARVARPTESGRAVVARVRPATRGGLDGKLVVLDPGMAAAERTVHAESCGELVTALAIIAAVVIDPLTARTGELDASADVAESASEVTTSARPPPPEPPPRSEDADAPAPLAQRARRAGRWELSAGLGGGLVAGSAPTILLSVPVFVELARDDRDILSPALRIRGERTSTSSNHAGGAFVRTGGAVDLCPFSFRARSLRAQPCGRAELAALHASGRGVEPTRSEARPWLAFGAVGRVRVELVPPLFVELEGGFMVPAIRDRFFVEPFAVVYRTPAFGATSAFAVGATF